MRRSNSHDEDIRQIFHDLDVGRQVQQGLYPGPAPYLPGCDCAARCLPARVVAGDYHDLFEAAPDRWAIALGDVSGKGFGPALVAAGLHALVRATLPQATGDIAGLMAVLNGYLLEVLPPGGMFVTLFLAVLDAGTGRLLYVNAGHPPPVLLSQRRGRAERLVTGGLVLGVKRGVRYEQGWASLAPASLLALFSDGITEAKSGRAGLFREGRLVRVLREAWASPATAILDKLLTAVERFVGRTGPTDDRSLIILRKLGGGAETNGKAK